MVVPGTAELLLYARRRVEEVMTGTARGLSSRVWYWGRSSGTAMASTEAVQADACVLRDVQY
eukprot:3622250-Rhodomonas_salina.3